MTLILICIVISTVVSMFVVILFSPEQPKEKQVTSNKVDYEGTINDLQNNVKSLEKKLNYMKLIAMTPGDVVRFEIYKRDYDFLNTLFPKEMGFHVVVFKEIKELKVVGGQNNNNLERVKIEIKKV